MPTSRTTSILHSAILAADAADPTDGQLLERFLTRHDETAFAALLRRHGPMVLGVCRRVAGNVHDADDAFQATFLVLVRKAASIVPREAVGNWLYGVAYRTALEARTATARRRAREKPMKDVPHPTVAPAPEPDELRTLLDHELSRLPDKYRLPVVLCELEGKSRKEVARLLNLPEGTLSSRLATARRRLAARLTRRGLTLAGGGVAAALAPQAAAVPVPLSLLGSTFQAAALVAAGQAPAAVVPARIATLTEGVLKAMLIKKLTTALTAVLVLAFAVGGAVLAYRTWAADPVAAQAKAGSPPVAPRTDRSANDKDSRAPEVPADHEVKPQVLPNDAERVWTLDFRFRDLRALTVDLPGKGKKTVWYLCYEVSNHTDEPRTFLPAFDLVTDDKPGVTTDSVLPKALKEIAQVEDPTQFLNLKNSVSIAAEPIAPLKPKAPPRGVWGVATWDNLDPEARRFTLFVSGLSNGWTVDDNQVVRRKTLRLDFKRVGDKLVFVGPAQWVYRTTQGEVPAKEEGPSSEVRQLKRAIEQVQGCISQLDQRRLEWHRQRERLQMRLSILQGQLDELADDRLTRRAELQDLERQRAAGDFEDQQHQIEWNLLNRRREALEHALKEIPDKESER